MQRGDLGAGRDEALHQRLAPLVPELVELHVQLEQPRGLRRTAQAGGDRRDARRAELQALLSHAVC